MEKSYKNLDFLMSPEARTIRILAEYLEPQQRFEKLGVNNAVIFYGSARLDHKQARDIDGVNYYQEARGLARELALWTTANHEHDQRYHVCTGGGPGIMQAANQGAHEVDPDLSVGFNISLPFEQDANPFVTDKLAFEFHYFFMRKFWFMNLAKGMVIFPGGFGTMDELFELLTLIQTGKSEQVPIVLFGKSFWNKLINFDVFLEHGLISDDDLNRFSIVESIEEAMGVLKKGLG